MQKQNYRCQINHGSGLLTWKREIRATTVADAAKDCITQEGFSNYALILPGQHRGYNHDEGSTTPIPVWRFTAVKPMDRAIHIWVECID